MKIGIVGYPGSGKTTIFNALSGLRAETGFGGKTRDHLGVIKVPDERVERLAELSQAKKKTYAEVVFVDVAGRAGGAQSKGLLNPQTIQAMVECDALVLVLRDFANPMLPESTDAAREMAGYREELILSDLMPLDNRRSRMRKESGREKEKALIERCIERLESGQSLLGMPFTPEERTQLSGFALLSSKPFLYLLNQEEDAVAQGIPQALQDHAAAEGAVLMGISAKIEMDIAELPAEDQAEFLQELGVDSLVRDRFIRKSYELLELITFLTTGDPESRAWPIRQGTTAAKAAGKIHSDIERGFIRAEVIAYPELMAAGGYKQARDQGLLRLEGKEYLVREGDVILFRFNV